MCRKKLDCSLIDGAELQVKGKKMMFFSTYYDFPKCQCASATHSVFCSTTPVGSRVFDGLEVLQNAKCSNPICSKAPSCQEVEGAEPQQGKPYPNCKCKKHLHSIQCNQTVAVRLADQGFDAASQVWANERCVAPRCVMAGADCPQKFNFDDVQEYVDNNRQAKEEDGQLAQMASLSNRINNLFSPVAGWTLQLHWDTGEERECRYVERVGIYTRDHTCALVFSSLGAGGGAKMLKDGLDAFPTTTEWCGIDKVLSGYADRLNDFIWGSRFQEFKDFLRSEANCSGGVIGVGHSMGGALTALMATCANRFPEKYWKTDALYTFAAPAPTYKHQLVNALPETFPVEVGVQKPGCFKGFRVYSDDKTIVDPIPAVSTLFHFKHPKMREYKITAGADGNYTKEERACDSEHAATYPIWEIFSFKSGFLGMKLHPATVYVQRILALSGIVRSPAQDEPQFKDKDEG